MELLITIAYLFAIRLVFFDFKWLRFNLIWGLLLGGLYLSAALTEIVLLGQYTPYSKSVFAQTFVIPMAPHFGGKIVEVHAVPGTPIKKGEPLFDLDHDTFQHKVDELQASLVLAKQRIKELEAEREATSERFNHEKVLFEEAQAALEEAKARVEAAQEQLKLDQVVAKSLTKAAAQGAAGTLRVDRAQQDALISQATLVGAKAELNQAKLVASDRSPLLEAEATLKKIELSLEAMIDGEHASVREIESQLKTAQVHLQERTVYAPSDGYVANLQLHPGVNIRLKTPVMAFVSSQDPWLVVKVRQKGGQWIAAGDLGEVALDMYPGKVFPAVVENIVWASGNAQLLPTGTLPKEQLIEPGEHFFVIMRITNEDPEHPIRFGAKGIAAIYTKRAPDFLKVIRKIEIRSESYLNYLYNPF
jgi:multidrug resistance efflux pump